MATELTEEHIDNMLPERPEDGHKGTFGHLFIVATSRGFTGAGKLAAEAAGRSGVGLVTVGVPASLADVVATGLYEAMSLALPNTESDTLSHHAIEPALNFAKGKGAVALGMGISTQEDTRTFVRTFVAGCPVPLLIDADGLNCLAEAPSIIAAAPGPVVITPHPGEMARLAGCETTDVQREREGIALKFAEEHECVVVLKGRDTVIAAPDGRAFIIPTGNAGLATGGTGDVLSGLMGGLMAQGIDVFDAACIGAFAHGAAGDFAAEIATERGLIARDVIDALPDVWGAFEEGRY